MNETMFILLRFAMLIVLAIITRYVIPYLQKSIDNAELGYLQKAVTIAVLAAEQTITAKGAGIEKKEIVTRFIKNMLISKNIPISDQQIDNLIESAVYMFNFGNTKGKNQG